ncbi:MAG: DUF4194 domain-containing protein [Erysipelotrichaceae bacterium]|nr:DUF4194 domain-containing protein [Erysipelotrichaceae bacterium]
MKIEILGENDKIHFEETIQKLLRYNHLNKYLLNRKGTRELNEDYQFVKDNFDIFYEYLKYAGFQLHLVDDQYEKSIIYLESKIEISKYKLHKLETACLFVLRLLYEEEKMGLKSDNKTIVTMKDLYTNLVGVFNIYSTDPLRNDILEALAVLERMNVIKVIKKQDDDIAIEIYPYICYVLTNEKIKLIVEGLREGGGSNETE